jgi:hypothetical protein
MPATADIPDREIGSALASTAAGYEQERADSEA